MRPGSGTGTGFSANWDDPNSRPAALWEYDYGLTRVGWPRNGAGRAG